jgi:hypothetical protein
MKNKNKSAVAKNAYGKTLPKPVPYSFDWTEYENTAEQKAANDMLTDDEQRKARNTSRKSKARQASLTAALLAVGIVKPDIKNDEQLRLREFVKVLMSSGKYTDEAARQLASETLDVKWADEDDDDDDNDE